MEKKKRDTAKLHGDPSALALQREAEQQAHTHELEKSRHMKSLGGAFRVAKGVNVARKPSVRRMSAGPTSNEESPRQSLRKTGMSKSHDVYTVGAIDPSLQ